MGMTHIPRYQESLEVMNFALVSQQVGLSLNVNTRRWTVPSQGAEIRFEVQGGAAAPLSVFTTRADTLYGVTYMCLAPEHPSLATLTTPAQQV
jgi:leucyl-tRNA synthetase